MGTNKRRAVKALFYYKNKHLFLLFIHKEVEFSNKGECKMLKMYAELDGKLNGQTFAEYNQGLSFGGFCFRCMINGEDKSVNIDWPSFVGTLQNDGSLLLMEGEGSLLGKNGELDDVYDKEYEKEGFSREDLTAKLLSETTEIEEFVVDYETELGNPVDDYLHIRSVTFVDDIGAYAVSGEVLDRFNEMMPYEPIRAEGDLSCYDEFDGLYPDESDLVPAASCSNQKEFEDYEEDLPF